MQRHSSHSSSGEGRAPRGLSKPPLSAPVKQETFDRIYPATQKKETEVSLRLSNFVLQMKKYNHLTAEQRYTIDVLLRQKKSRKEISDTIGISEPTLSRELKRNSGQRGYHWQQAQSKADNRKCRLQNYRNLTIEICNFIRTKMTK